MTVCRYCESEMASAEGCSEAPIVMADGTVFEAVRYGQETGWGPPGRRCGDCGVLPGRVHHHGCDVEECPRCNRQAITCGCRWQGEEDDGDEEEEVWSGGALMADAEPAG